MKEQQPINIEQARKAREWLTIQGEARILRAMHIPLVFEWQQALFALEDKEVAVFTEIEPRLLEILPKAADKDDILSDARIVSAQSSVNVPLVSMVLDVPHAAVSHIHDKRRPQRTSTAYVVSVLPGEGIRFQKQERRTYIDTGKRGVYGSENYGPILTRYELDPAYVRGVLQELLPHKRPQAL